MKSKLAEKRCVLSSFALLCPSNTVILLSCLHASSCSSNAESRNASLT